MRSFQSSTRHASRPRAPLGHLDDDGEGGVGELEGPAVKAAMEEEIRSLLNWERGSWSNVRRESERHEEPVGVDDEVPVDDTVEREKARLVVKGFTQVYGADYDETVLYMSQPDYFNDGTGRGVQAAEEPVDEALYFKDGKDGVACWVLVYVDDLLAASSSAAMLKELKELLEAAFELREISPVQKYLGLEIVRDRSAGKLWLHQQGYADKLRAAGRGVPAEGRLAAVRGNDDEAGHRLRLQQAGERPHGEERPALREVDRCPAYLANTRDTALEFGGGPESLELVGYVDADDAGDKQNRTSTGGYVFVYGGAAVSLLDAGKPTVLRVDNKSAITVVKGMGLTGNLKHMERRQAWLQHMVKRGSLAEVRLADVGDEDDNVQQ
ncbi:unnamed protein product [Closterium sp. NIES-64]|nr:unnamed protein product [Closterium sp. NIES-64]